MEAFRDFVLLKAYDVVSGGQFRKHVSASKERGDAWACAMQAHHNATSDAVKELLASLLSMKDDHFRDLQVLAHPLLLSLSCHFRDLQGLSHPLLLSLSCHFRDLQVLAHALLLSLSCHFRDLHGLSHPLLLSFSFFSTLTDPTRRRQWPGRL